MSKIYVEKNVLDASIERLNLIFQNFNHVYFSVSGGKDSSVMIQLANMVAKRLNKKFDILFIDLEAQYQYTIKHVYELKGLSQVRDFIILLYQLHLEMLFLCYSPNGFVGKKKVNIYG